MSQTTANAPTPSVGVILPPNEIRSIKIRHKNFFQTIKANFFIF